MAAPISVNVATEDNPFSTARIDAPITASGYGGTINFAPKPVNNPLFWVLIAAGILAVIYVRKK